MNRLIKKSWKDEERKAQIDMLAEQYSCMKIADATLEVYKLVV